MDCKGVWSGLYGLERVWAGLYGLERGVVRGYIDWKGVWSGVILTGKGCG